MTKKIPIQVRLPEGTIAEIDKSVKTGKFMNRSDFIRDSIRKADKDKRLEWLFKERKYRDSNLASSFMQYFFIIFLYIFKDIFGWWWLIYMILYILAVLISPSVRKVQKEIDKEIGFNE